MNIENIKQAISRHISFFKLVKDSSSSKMYRHWEIILITFLVLNLILFSFSLYLFLQINEGGIFLVEQDQDIRIDTIDRGVLQELLRSFDIKDSLFQDRAISAPRLKDPSI